MKKKKKKGKRINKYLSACGIGSRRNCEKFIKQGKVSVNGETVTDFSTYINKEDVVRFDGKKIEPEEKTYIVFNKPKGVVTTLKDSHHNKIVGNYFQDLPYIKPVGRLDKNTTGTLLLTNDGDLLYKLTHPKYQVPKKYVVTLNKPIKGNISSKIAKGITLDNGEVAKGQIININNGNKPTVTMILREGKNREIRRIFKCLGYKVKELDRISFAIINYQNLKRGEWRELTEKEVKLLKKMVN